MKSFTPAAVVLAALAGTTLAGDECAHTGCGEHAVAHTDEVVIEKIAESLIHMLPERDQRLIVEAGGLGSHAIGLDHFTYEVDRSKTADIDPDITPSEYRDMLFSDELKARMTELQHTMVNRIVEQLEAGVQPPMMCFAPDADREYADAINQLLEFRFQIAFQQTSRWTSTATNGNGLQQGEPTTITYSFVPDGTTVPNLIGVSGSSNFRAWMNGIYGSQAVWQPLYDQVFDRWAELTGTSYVYEPNDDGSTLNTGGGILGQRGDVRIAAITIDGGSGTLAYNNFPNDGDMVFDSADNFFNSTGGNSLRLRNVIAHEHGHGLGMLHVCPANQTKLMEPFVSTAYDGPQLDDILNGQRHYGDPNEPNGTFAAATSLGSFGVGNFGFLTNVSLDDNGDQDFYEIVLTEPGEVTVTIGPDAATYDQGPQTQSCASGSSTNYNTIHDLRIRAFSSSDFVNPIASSNSTGVGGDETVVFQAETAGTYYLLVDPVTSANNIQRYDAIWSVGELPFLAPTIAANAPAAVDPGVPNSFDVTIDPREDTLDGMPMLFSSVNNGPFNGSALVSTGGNNYTATLPVVNCGDDLEFFISIVGDVSGPQVLPSGGQSAPFEAEVGEFVVDFEDNFQTNQGWSVSGNPATGDWERVIPSQGNDGRVADPETDFDGSGFCYVTGNGDQEDVDGGTTILTSPAFDISENPEAVVSYARWFDNNEGGSASEAFTETFVVEISNNNGATWSQLEEVGPTGPQVSGGWFEVSFRIADFVAPSDAVRVRFIASDDPGTIVEAAVDAFSISGLVCEDPQVDPCPVDLDDSGALNFGDVTAFLTLYGMGDLTVDFDNSGSLNFGDVTAFLTLYAAGCP